MGKRAWEVCITVLLLSPEIGVPLCPNGGLGSPFSSRVFEPSPSPSFSNHFPISLWSLLCIWPIGHKGSWPPPSALAESAAANCRGGGGSVARLCPRPFWRPLPMTALRTKATSTWCVSRPPLCVPYLSQRSLYFPRPPQDYGPFVYH